MSDLGQEGTSSDRLLSLDGLMFTCHVFAPTKGQLMRVRIVGFKSSLVRSSLLSSKRS